MSDGPFTDDLLRHGLLAVQTQHGIVKYAEAMAQVLAEAARASHKATGDPTHYALDRWVGIIHQRARELLEQDNVADKAQYRKAIDSK